MPGTRDARPWESMTMVIGKGVPYLLLRGLRDPIGAPVSSVWVLTGRNSLESPCVWRGPREPSHRPEDVAELSTHVSV